jgi:glycosyltransferase 2 family protein
MMEPESQAASTAAEDTLPSRGRALRSGLVLLAKIAVATGLIVWLVRSGRLDFDVFKRITWDARTIGLAAAGLAAVFLGQWFLAVRIWLLLWHGRIKMRLSRVFGVTLVGSLFSVVLPGLVGGDIVRAVYFCGDAAGHRAVAVGTVVLDRVIGLYSLFLAGAIAWVVIILSPTMAKPPAILLLSPVIAIVMTLGFWVAGYTRWQDWPGLRWVWRRLPNSIRNMVTVLQGSVGYSRLMLDAVVLSVLNHALVIGTFVIGALLLGDSLPWPTHFALSPLAMVMNMVAVTPGGIGLTEGAFSLLYESAGSSNGASIAICGRLIQYAAFVAAGCAALVWVRLGTKKSK